MRGISLEEIEVHLWALSDRLFQELVERKLATSILLFFQTLLPGLGLLLSLDFAFAVDFPIGNFGIVVILDFTGLEKSLVHGHLI